MFILNKKNPTRGEILVLSEKSIEQIEPTLFANFLHLEQLYLNQNKIKTLNIETFIYCNQLKILYLFENLIDEIEPSLFYNCQHLEELNLSGNKIKSLDKETFKYCNQLQKLDLSNNLLDKIDPKTIISSGNTVASHAKKKYGLKGENGVIFINTKVFLTLSV